MSRIPLILTLATVLIFGGLFYQYYVQKQDEQKLQAYQEVLLDKTEQILTAARHVDTPIQVDTSDARLSGDYQIMASFVLNQMIETAEARNRYIRDLKALDWDHFLDIERLSRDKKQQYVETEKMLKDVHAVVDAYAEQTKEMEKRSLDQAKHLAVSGRYSHQLTQSLRDSQKNDDAHALFELEQQSLAKADQIFEVLKNNRWEKKNKLFMFYEDVPLKQFNALYKEILALNQQMKQVSHANRVELENSL
jgi:hypothetical protein